MNLDFDYWTDKAKEEDPGFLREAIVEEKPDSLNVPEEAHEDTADLISVSEETHEKNDDLINALEENIEEVQDIFNVPDEQDTDATKMDIPISDNAILNVPVKDTASSGSGDVILNEHINDPLKKGKAGRICKAIFLGIPFGIPLFVIMLIVISAFVGAVCVLFGAMVIISAALVVLSVSLILLGISNVHLALAPSMLLMGAGILGTGLGILFALLTRLVFKYILICLIKCFVFPVRFVRLFFTAKKEVHES